MTEPSNVGQHLEPTIVRMTWGADSRCLFYHTTVMSSKRNAGQAAEKAEVKTRLGSVSGTHKKGAKNPNTANSKRPTYVK